MTAGGAAPWRRPAGAGGWAWFLVANGLEILAGAMLVGICLIVFAGVFFRYFLHIGLGWTEEAARYLQVWMTFLGATVAVKRRGHFQLMLLADRIPARFLPATRLFALSVVLALSVVMVWNGIEITEISWYQTSPIMEWNFGYLYLVVPVSGALMILFTLHHMLGVLRGDTAAIGASMVADPSLPGAHVAPVGEDRA